ncbi:MAG TPA: CAP domain-containing protein [Chloroflexia bacterium]|nr:CAP domain-containing protein [Chloroflexia bacterium]
MQASYTNPSTPSRPQSTTFRFRASLVQGIGSIALTMALLGQAFPMVNGVMPPARTAQALPSTGAPVRSQYFAPTGRTVRGDFLGTLERFGIERIGYPVSEERTENGGTVQYFERVRMESHPELSGRGYGVLMTRLGAQLAGGQYGKVAAFNSTTTRMYVKETGHSLSGAFLSYWKNNGAVDLFGYPISEPLSQNGLTVQWFERARMEYHPEQASTGKRVQLSLLGRMAYERTGAPEAKLVSQQRSSQQAPAQAPAPAPVQAQVTLAPVEGYMLKEINQQRAAAGLQPVQVDGSITELSRTRSNDMAERNYFSHTTPEGKNFLPMMGDRKIAYKFAGEILARNNYPDADAPRVAMESYLNSSAHKAIMLDGRFTLVGIGYTKSTEDEMQYFTVIFVQR